MDHNDTLEHEQPWLAETPFARDVSVLAPISAPQLSINAESPFLTEYLLGQETFGHSQDSETFATLLEQLHDPEFDEVIYQIAEEAAAAYGDTAATQGEVGSGSDPEAFVRRYLDPLRAEAEAMIDRFSSMVGDTDLSQLSEGEVDEMLERLDPGHTTLEPLFDGFIKKLAGKVKGVVKNVVNRAKSVASKILPIGKILARIKRLVRPLLDRVLKFAINKLPPTLRPLASRLAKRLLRETPGPESDFEGHATADVTAIQEQFDMALASLTFAEDEVESDLMIAESMPTEVAGADAVANFHAARERFIQEIVEMPPDGDPSPAVEQFLPAILPMVKLGIKIIGRPKVVAFLAKFLARLIARYVGAGNAQMLSRAIVDAGLRLINLEAPDGDERLGATAVAATVEETVRRLAELDEAYFEDEALLQEGLATAFEKAAATNFPPGLLKPSVRATDVNGTWVALPRSGPAFYKKFSRPLKARISPQMARRIRLSGGKTLATHLKDRFGVEGETEVTAHLYEAGPGARPALIARAESGVAGLGTSERIGWQGLEYLSAETAAVLFGEPGLGSEVPSTGPNPTLNLGERLFYMEIAGRQPMSSSTAADSSFRLALDTTGRGQLTATMFLSEADAQAVASVGKSGRDLSQQAARILETLKPQIDRVLSGQRSEALSVVIGDASIPRAVGRDRFASIVERIPGFSTTVLKWLQDSLSGHVGLATEVAAAAEDIQSGITLVVRGQDVPALHRVRELLRRPAGGLADVRDLPAIGAPAASTVRISAGAST